MDCRLRISKLCLFPSKLEMSIAEDICNRLDEMLYLSLILNMPIRDITERFDRRLKYGGLPWRSLATGVRYCYYQIGENILLDERFQ